MLQSWDMFRVWAQAKFGTFFRDESGEVNVVAIVVLIGIAIILALVFKDGITKLLKDLIETISGKAKTAVGG